MEVYEETFESISFMLEKKAKAKKVEDDDVLDMFADSLDDDPKVGHNVYLNILGKMT